MIRIHLILNTRVGDSLSVAKKLLADPRSEHRIICAPFNYEVFKWFKNYTRVPIAEIEVVMGLSPLRNYDDYLFAVNNLAGGILAEIGEVITVADMNYYFIIPHKEWERPLSHEYITMQYDTISDWKCIEALDRCKYPLPVYVLSQKGLRTPKNGTILEDLEFHEVAKIVKGARFHIGVCSSVSKLAAMLGVPTIMCHFAQEFIEGNGVCHAGLNPLNKNLLLPTEVEIEAAMATMLCM